MKTLLMNSRIYSLIVALCFGILGTNPAEARHRKKVVAEAKITHVSSTSISIKNGSATHTYKISSNTAIHLDGRKVDAKHLKKGMHADVTASQLDPATASAIEASGS